jgi:predicted acetyltransferase
MAFTIGPVARERIADWMACDASAFGQVLDTSEIEDFLKMLQLDRAAATYDGDEIVSTAAVMPFEMSVPGNLAPMAGVTWVSVKPTHRRQGIVSEMMRHQLTDIRERGEPLASLWASESIIYGRFGYGLSTESVGWSIERPHARLASGDRVAGRYRLVTIEEVLRDWPQFYDSVRSGTPGMFSRTEPHWRYHRFYTRDKDKARFWVQYEVAGAIAGYVHYRTTSTEVENLAANHLEVIELIAANDEAYRALWEYVFGVDLVAKISAYHRPVDEPLVHMLADTRRLLRRPQDGLWMRIVDAEAALSLRRYSREGSLVLDMTDPFLEWGNGRYLLEADADGATCVATTREPDISMGVRDLGAVYMGATSFTSLARAGRLEGDREALLQADAMFRWDPLPWCPEVF